MRIYKPNIIFLSQQTIAYFSFAFSINVQVNFLIVFILNSSFWVLSPDVEPLQRKENSAMQQERLSYFTRYCADTIKWMVIS